MRELTTSTGLLMLLSGIYLETIIIPILYEQVLQGSAKKQVILNRAANLNKLKCVLIISGIALLILVKLIFP